MVWQRSDSEQWQCNPRCGEEELEKQCLVQLLGPEECWRYSEQAFLCDQKARPRYAQSDFCERWKSIELAACKTLASKPSPHNARYAAFGDRCSTPELPLAPLLKAQKRPASLR